GDRMLVLKTIGLVLFFGVIAWFVAEFLNDIVMLEWVYPFALNYVVIFLKDKGHGFREEFNEQAQGHSIIIRVLACIGFYAVGGILLSLLIPPGLIRSGCLIGWFANGAFAVVYEFCMFPSIGRFDRLEEDSKSKAKVAVFKDLNNEEFRLSMEYWSENDYPQHNCRYAVMNTFNYQAFCPL
ncbi:hypothetical protein J5500_00925, partial [Candidatus Saccharibacteria bacterium]|nr:hypothetical protein [Candidatus Saccharibacteria bacterium]